MINSPWHGESQSDDGGRASPTNLLREPDFLKRLDEYTSMDQKDDHLEYYKRDRPYSFVQDQDLVDLWNSTFRAGLSGPEKRHGNVVILDVWGYVWSRAATMFFEL